VTIPRTSALKPVAVVLDLVHPVGPGGRLGGACRDAGRDETGREGLSQWHVTNLRQAGLIVSHGHIAGAVPSGFTAEADR
jgi:hypothetical protein